MSKSFEPGLLISSNMYLVYSKEPSHYDGSSSGHWVWMLSTYCSTLLYKYCCINGEHIRIYLIFKYVLIIYHECEGEIKNLPRIIDWHHEAYRVMTNGDPEGRGFLSQPPQKGMRSWLIVNRWSFSWQ